MSKAHILVKAFENKCFYVLVWTVYAALISDWAYSVYLGGEILTRTSTMFFTVILCNLIDVVFKRYRKNTREYVSEDMEIFLAIGPWMIGLLPFVIYCMFTVSKIADERIKNRDKEKEFIGRSIKEKPMSTRLRF